MAERDRPTPPRGAWGALWAAVRPEGAVHVVDTARLGEYAMARVQRGEAGAARRFPDVAAHLATSCGLCLNDLDELLAFARVERLRAATTERRRPWRYGALSDVESGE